MLEGLVVAPASFGRDSEAFVDAALRELGTRMPASGLVVATRAELVRAAGRLRPGSVVLGSIGSDLAIEVAETCRELGLVHVEAGALSDRVLGPGTFRLTAAAADSAAAVLRLTGCRRVVVVAEESEFASAVVEALSREGGGSLAEVVPVEEAVRRGADAVLRAAGAEVLAGVLRPPWPERLLGMPGGVGELIGVGSWARPEVGAAARRAGVRLRFCDVMPARLLLPGRLAPEVVRSLREHLERPPSVYRDLGWAAGLLLRRRLEDERPAESLAATDLTARETGFGHGVRFGPDGRNRLAGKAILEWVDGEMRLVAGPVLDE